MSTDFRYPKITAKDAEGQLRQMQSYMFQLVEQLNWAMKNVVSESSASGAYAVNTSTASGGTEAQDQATFNSIKSLIIKSADIVNAYYETINSRLKGQYVAKSTFGTFVEETTSELEATSSAINQVYTDLQEIITDIENAGYALIDVTAHIKSGLLYYGDDGAPVYGLEIGQRTEIDGVEHFNKYARFTAEKLSFYDSNDNEVAYISDKKLYITHVEVTGSFSLGGFVDKVLPDRSVVTKWVVGGEG